MLLDELEEVKEHINRDHADTVELIGRFVASDRVGAEAEVAAALGDIDGAGLDIRVAADGGDEFIARHHFATNCASVDEVRGEFLSLLAASREWVGDRIPLTSLESEFAGSEYTTFISEVAAVVDLTPTLRQITFRGGLDDFESLGGDQFLYVLLPPRGRDDLTIDSSFNWNQYEEMDESDRPAGAYYTVRRWRPDERELDMWFVLHSDAGASAAWAARAQPGQPVGLWGPRRAFDAPHDTEEYLLVADETGFGAVAAVLDELLVADADVSVSVLAEIGGPAGRVDLPTGPNVRVTWVDRAGAAPGTTSHLIDAVSEHDIAQRTYAFGAAESRRITAVRKHLRDLVGLEAERVSMTGYWRLP